MRILLSDLVVSVTSAVAVLLHVVLTLSRSACQSCEHLNSPVTIQVTFDSEGGRAHVDISEGI